MSPPATNDRMQAATSKPHEYERWFSFGGPPPTQKSLHCSLKALSPKIIAADIRNTPTISQ